MNVYLREILIICVAAILVVGCKQISQKENSNQIDLDFFHRSIGEGDPIIVIHGGPGLGSAYLEEHLSPLSEDYQVIFYDQVNSGRSTLNSDSSRVSLASFLNDINDVRIYYDLDRISIIAHSWGGILGMKYALTYPNYVENLILINSNAADSDINNQANTRLANRFSADDLEARTTVMRSAAFQAGKPEAFEELMNIGFAYQFSNPNLINQLQLQLPSDFAQKSRLLGGLFQELGVYNFNDDVSKLSCNTLLLFGLDDPSTPLILNSLSNVIPSPTIEVIDDAGHFPFIEKKEATTKAIQSFLEQN